MNDVKTDVIVKRLNHVIAVSVKVSAHAVLGARHLGSYVLIRRAVAVRVVQNNITVFIALGRADGSALRLPRGNFVALYVVIVVDVFVVIGVSIGIVGVCDINVPRIYNSGNKIAIRIFICAVKSTERGVVIRLPEKDIALYAVALGQEVNGSAVDLYTAHVAQRVGSLVVV